MLLSNYFDCCTNQCNNKTQVPSKEALQKLYKSYKAAMLPVVDVNGVKLFEYICKQANTNYPMKFEGKIQRQELASDIYAYGKFTVSLLLFFLILLEKRSKDSYSLLCFAFYLTYK
jgi:hypothetical protein